MKWVITSNFWKMKDCLKKFMLWPGFSLALYFEAGWTVTGRNSPPAPEKNPVFLQFDTYHAKFNMVSLNLRVEWQIAIKWIDWLPLIGSLPLLSEEGRTCLGTVYFLASKKQYGRGGNIYHRIRWLVWTLIQSGLFSRCIKTFGLKFTFP